MLRIVQCLCPSRHCILAIAYEPEVTAAQKDFGSGDDITLTEDNAARYLQTIVEGLVERGTLNHKCELCGSQEFAYEDRKSIFRTMEEALPLMKRLEEEQLRARSVMSRN